MTAVERAFEYVSLPGEEKSDENKEKLMIKKTKAPPKNWPTTGNIKFENVSFHYDANLPYVLNNLTFEIKSGEKIGIVGRTGAGKSSIIQTLFRMAEPDGTIYIDNLNIKDISLRDLRNKISIIPVTKTAIFIY